jgi:hypothetical protein
MRRLGLVLAGLLGCGDDRPTSPPDLVGDIAVESVASVPSDKVLAAGLAGIDVRTFVVARATTQGADFCPECLDPGSTDCAATCRRAVLEVTRFRTNGASDPPNRFLEVFPASVSHDVGGIQIVSLDDTHVGFGWLECDYATCGPSLPKQSCTARYTTIDLLTGRHGSIETLYQGWYGELQLAFDPRTRRLLAVVGTQGASSAGVRAAIFDQEGAAVMPWQPYGGVAASAPAATATADGFLLVADDPAPSKPAPVDACAESCDCLPAGTAELATGGLYAFRPGVDRPAERISPGRGPDGAYVARQVIAAIEAGGRAVVASTQATDGAAELFEPTVGGWTRRHSSQAPAPMWLGALGDATHLAWLGCDLDDASAAHHLVAGVVLIGELEQRGEIMTLDPGFVLRAAPIQTDDAVTTTFLLHSVEAPARASAAPRRFEVLAVRAGW